MPKMEKYLTADEIKWIKNNQERCEYCGHLEIFHYVEGGGNTFCIVGKKAKDKWGNSALTGKEIEKLEKDECSCVS